MRVLLLITYVLVALLFRSASGAAHSNSSEPEIGNDARELRIHRSIVALFAALSVFWVTCCWLATREAAKGYIQVKKNGAAGAKVHKSSRRPSLSSKLTSWKRRASVHETHIESSNRMRMDALALLSCQGLLTRTSTSKTASRARSFEKRATEINGSEEAKGEKESIHFNRIVGWLSLLFEIPTMLMQPFLLNNAWPEKLRIPFHDVSSILYIGEDHSSIFTAFQLYLYAFLLLMVEAARAAQKSPSVSRAARKMSLSHERICSIRYFGSRILFDAFYCMAVYKAAGSFRFYTCPAVNNSSAFSNATTLCSIHLRKGENGTWDDMGLKSVNLNIGIMIVSACILFFSFLAAMHYILVEKNAANPAFMWLASYNTVLFGGKTVSSAMAAILKHHPVVCLPLLLAVNLSLAVLTNTLQPCQGLGRRPNNMRFISFVVGAWTCVLGIVSFAVDLNSIVKTPLHVAACFVGLIGSVFVIGLAAKRFNNVRARQFTMPEIPVADMIKVEGNSKYVRRVACHALMILVNDESGTISKLIKKSVFDDLIFTQTEREMDPFIKWRGAVVLLGIVSTLRGMGDEKTRSVRFGSDTGRFYSTFSPGGPAFMGIGGRRSICQLHCCGLFSKTGSAFLRIMDGKSGGDQYSTKSKVSPIITPTKSGRFITRKYIQDRFLKGDILSRCARSIVRFSFERNETSGLVDESVHFSSLVFVQSYLRLDEHSAASFRFADDPRLYYYLAISFCKLAENADTSDRMRAKSIFWLQTFFIGLRKGHEMNQAEFLDPELQYARSESDVKFQKIANYVTMNGKQSSCAGAVIECICGSRRSMKSSHADSDLPLGYAYSTASILFNAFSVRKSFLLSFEDADIQRGYHVLQELSFSKYFPVQYCALKAMEDLKGIAFIDKKRSQYPHRFDTLDRFAELAAAVQQLQNFTFNPHDSAPEILVDESPTPQKKRIEFKRVHSSTAKLADSRRSHSLLDIHTSGKGILTEIVKAQHTKSAALGVYEEVCSLPHELQKAYICIMKVLCLDEYHRKVALDKASLNGLDCGEIETKTTTRLCSFLYNISPEFVFNVCIDLWTHFFAEVSDANNAIQAANIFSEANTACKSNVRATIRELTVVTSNGPPSKSFLKSFQRWEAVAAKNETLVKNWRSDDPMFVAAEKALMTWRGSKYVL